MPRKRTVLLAIVLSTAGFRGSPARAQQPVSFGPPSEAQFAAIVPAGCEPRETSGGFLGESADVISTDHDIWAAISRKGGHPFSRSLRISHARSPAVDPYRNAGLFGDDIQDLALSPSDLYVVWADNRAGFQAIWLGRAPLSEFQFAGGEDGHEPN